VINNWDVKISMLFAVGQDKVTQIPQIHAIVQPEKIKYRMELFV